MEEDNVTQYAGKVLKVGNSLMITIPSRTAEYSEIMENDLVKVWIKKKEE